MEGGSVMGFQVGDWVRVRLPKESLIWGSRVNGKIFKVRARNDRIYFLFYEFGFSYKEEWLELVKAAVRAPVRKVAHVSVGRDLTKDLSITKGQYKRIRFHAKKTGHTTTEVLRMLLAAAMECFFEEGPRC